MLKETAYSSKNGPASIRKNCLSEGCKICPWGLPLYASYCILFCHATTDFMQKHFDIHCLLECLVVSWCCTDAPNMTLNIIEILKY